MIDGATCLSSSIHFPISSGIDEREPGDVAAGPREAGDEAEADRIVHQRADDRDGLGQLLQRASHRRAVGEDHVRLQRDQFLGVLLNPADLTRHPSGTRS